MAYWLALGMWLERGRGLVLGRDRLSLRRKGVESGYCY
jgi:hypothetical protein